MLKICSQNFLQSNLPQDLIQGSRMVAFMKAMSLDQPHKNCTVGNYPGSSVERLHVPEDKVAWDASWPEYNPPEYNADKLKSAPYADPDLRNEGFHPAWNKQDGPINRASYGGEYSIVDGIPRNPKGRTGLKGRGRLGRWGPNHAADPIVTRWKTDKTGNRHFNGDHKPILQFVAIQRRDNGEWAFPGGMVDPGEIPEETVVREFKEEAVDHGELSEKEKELNKQLISQFMVDGKEVFRGYVDDPRNTDNAWMETAAINFHDPTGSHLALLRLRAGSDAKAVRWVDVNKNLNLYANHSEILQKVAEMWNASW